VAYDLTPTRNRTIVIGGIVAAASLFGLHFVFDSYFVQVTEGIQHEKLASPEQLLATRAAEHKALASGPVPLESAMAQLARQGRSGGSAEINPQQSTDIGALTGWNKMPRKSEAFTGAAADLAGSLANNPTAAEGDAGAAAAVAEADAGVPLAAVPGHAGAAGANDAGAPHSTGADAGTTNTPQH